MMRALVAVVCLTSAGIIAWFTHHSSGKTGEPVYTVPPRAPDPVPAPPVPAPPAPAAAAKPIDPTDRVALARALQRELKRVGCYHGEITGVWTTSSRMAIKTFNERVNATLPVDNPDPVLLSLVQNHRDRACGAACPPGQTPAEDGVCVPNAMVAKVAKALPEAKSESEKAGDVPSAAGATAASAAAVTVPAAPRKMDPSKMDPSKTNSSKADPSKADLKAALSQPKAPAPGAVRPATVGPGRGPEAPPPGPPKVVRDVLKVLGFYKADPS
jgi:hypothetical protein